MIISNYNIEQGLEHSYPNTPPNYSDPQILYTFTYEGIMTSERFLNSHPGEKIFTWTINPPFFIISGQGSTQITCELIPKLNINKEIEKTAVRKLKYTKYEYSELNLTVEKYSESINLYYKQGPLWKIEGNKTPTINTTETYTLIPKYIQTGYPPKNKTNDSYTFTLTNGKVMKIHGNIPPNGNPLVDVFWYSTGSTYLSFYSTWENEQTKFPNTIGIYVKN